MPEPRNAQGTAEGCRRPQCADQPGAFGRLDAPSRHHLVPIADDAREIASCPSIIFHDEGCPARRVRLSERALVDEIVMARLPGTARAHRSNGVYTGIVEDASRFARTLIVQEAGIATLANLGVQVLTSRGDGKRLRNARRHAPDSRRVLAARKDPSRQEGQSKDLKASIAAQDRRHAGEGRLRERQRSRIQPGERQSHHRGADAREAHGVPRAQQLKSCSCRSVGVRAQQPTAHIRICADWPRHND